MGKVDTVYNKVIKRTRANNGDISCAICPYHKNENAPRHKPRPDKYKSKHRTKFGAFADTMTRTNWYDVT